MTKSNVMPLKNGSLISDEAPVMDKAPIQFEDGQLSITEPTWSTSIGAKTYSAASSIAEHVVLISALKGQCEPQRLAANATMVMGMAPKDHVEMMLATQMVAVHQLAITMIACATSSTGNTAAMDAYTRHTNQLMRTFAAQTEALKRYRTGGKQTVKVKHVHVHEGGQAIVGNVTKGVGGE